MDEQRQQALINKAHNQMTNATRFVWVTFQRAGFHKFPAAEKEPIFADVSYLGNRHRHLFKFKVAVQIFHNDREIEFHQLLNFCENQFGPRIDINNKSVEMLADDLYSILAIRYPQRKMIIDVAEDGECGCSIEYPVL